MKLVVVFVLAALCGPARADEQSPAPPADAPPPSVAIPSAPRPAENEHDPACADRDIGPRLTGLLRAKRYADAHHAAVFLRVMCGDATDHAWRLADDIALLRLEDRPIALGDLEELARGGDANAATVLAWAYVDNRDTAAAKTALARLPAPRQLALRTLGNLDNEYDFVTLARRLPAPLSQQALAVGDDYHDARAKSPAAAGILSAIVPGAGQIYAGSFEAAAITFALNALFISATVELALDEHYATAAAAGTAASFFYVGGIINAVDLARRRNHIAQQPYADHIEELLVPELVGNAP